MRLLYVEDSPALQRSVGEGLRRTGHVVDIAADGEEGLWYALSHTYDVLILDLMLPKLDGLGMTRNLRDAGHTVPILLLTARGTLTDRVTGLDAGADDYLPKPFEFPELLARVRALGRRHHGLPANPIDLGGGLSLDLRQRELYRRGSNQPLTLTAREFALLEFLALRMGQVVSRAEIEQGVYDERAEPSSNVVEVAICNLRRKLDTPGQPSLILTRRGMGYILPGTMHSACADREDNE